MKGEECVCMCAGWMGEGGVCVCAGWMGEGGGVCVCMCAGWMGEGGGVCVCVGITAQRLCKCDHPPTPHPSPQFYQKYMNTHLMCNNVKVQGRPTSRGLI